MSEIDQLLVPGVILGVTLVAVAVAVFLQKEKKQGKVFLDRERHDVPLLEAIELSHDTKLFRFGLPNKNDVLGLPVGKHIKIFAPNKIGVKEGEWNGRPDPEEGDEVSRTYTPVTSNDDTGHFDLVIKVYKSGVLDRFPDGGKISQYLNSLKVGDTVSVSGPYGLNEYIGNGVFTVSRKPRTPKKHIGMIAGGTGITPMLQIITAIFKNPSDKTCVSLLYANQSEDDILVREKIEGFAKQFPDRFKFWYTVDRPPAVWEYSSGFVCEEMIREHLPPAGEDSCVVLCGPPPMIKFACEPNLEKVGYDRLSILKT